MSGGGRLKNRVHDESSCAASIASVSAPSDSAHHCDVSEEEYVTVSGRSRQHRHRLQLFTANIDQVIGLIASPTNERIDQLVAHVSSSALIYYI